MAPSQFQIEILRNGLLSYFPGQTIEGILHVTAEQECKCEGIKVSFKGKATVQWSEQETVQVNNHGNRNSGTETRTVYYSAEEKYFDANIYVLGTGSSSVILQPGRYQYPFQFTLPQRLPSSFVGAHGMVSYEMKAEMERSWKVDITAKVPFTVNGIVDLNNEARATEAMETRKFKNLCCLCCKSGPIGFLLKIPRTGYVSGEFLKFTAELTNQSNRKVNGVNIYLVQEVSYRATKKTKTVSRTVCKAKGPAVEAGDTEIWTGNVLQIPPLPPTRLAHCRIIDVQYLLKIEMDVAGPAINLRHEFPIIIGSIPLRNTFSEIQTLRPQQQQPSVSYGVNSALLESAPTPSAPSKAVNYSNPNSSQASYFQENYPDMPPPTYAETIEQDRFNLQTFGSGEFPAASAPPAESIDFAPKYITYAWQT